MHNKDLTGYDALLKMIRYEIINEELREHQNKENRGLSPPQMQREKCPTLHLMDQVEHLTSLNPGQALTVATLSAALP